MFSLAKVFGKKKDSAVEIVPEFRSARDMHTFASHIVKADEVPLCGSEFVLFGKYEVTVESVLETAKHQHVTSYLCADCASTMTGKTASFFTEARNSSRK